MARALAASDPPGTLVCDPLAHLSSALRGRHLSPGTARAYEQALRAFVLAHPELRGPQPLGRAEAVALARRWLLARRAQGRSCVHAVAALTLVYGPGLRVPRTPARPRPPLPDRATLRRVLLLAPPDAPRAATALLLAGLRPGELLALRVADLDPLGLRARPGRRRALLLPPGLRLALGRLAQGEASSRPLFRGRRGAAICARTLQRWLREAAGRAGLAHPLPPAELRRAGLALRALGQDPMGLWPEHEAGEPRGNDRCRASTCLLATSSCAEFP